MHKVNVLTNKTKMLQIHTIFIVFIIIGGMDCNDCLSAETVVLLMTDGFNVFHIRMALGKNNFWNVSVLAKG